MADKNGQKRVGDIIQMGFGSGGFKGDEGYKIILWALEAGYRHIDTAQRYGNEAEVGRAIRASGIPRQEIFVTTKIHENNYGPGELKRSYEESLEKLDIGPVDLLLLHWPSIDGREPAEQYIGELGQLLDDGAAKKIGVSNFTIALIDEATKVLGARKISANQCEIHAYLQNRTLVNHCQSIGVPMMAFCPLGRSAVVGDPVLAKIGEAHGAAGEQIALAFLLSQDIIIIPSSGNKERIISNFEARNIKLSAAEIDQIKALERGQRVAGKAWDVQWDV